MKNHICNFPVIVFFLFLLNSCGNHENHTNDQTTNDSIVNQDSYISDANDSLIPFRGLWLNEKYYTELIKTKSPRTAQEIVNLNCIYFPDRFSQKAMLIFNFHEGINDLTIIKKVGAYQFLNDSNNAKTIEYTVSGPLLKYGNDNFIKLKQKVTNGNDQKIIEEVLFSGHYKLNNKDVYFSADGSINGLESMKYYMPLIDYIDAGMQVDQVKLGSSPEENKLYGFKFSGDSLYIYNLHCLKLDDENDMCVDVEFGDVKYKLKKVVN